MIKLPSQDIAVVKYKNHSIIMHTPNNYTERRAYSMFEKEPETTNWILKMNKDDVLWDIGACIGTYTLMAGVVAGISVHAFEPLYANVNNLNSNIVLNKLEDKCKAYCCAVSDKTGFGVLDYSMFDAPGLADTQINDTRSFKQGILTYSIDDLIELGIPYPTHVKIDVDGVEGKILKGGIKTFQNVKSILVEMQYMDRCNDEEQECIYKLVEYGFKFNKDVVSIGPKNNPNFPVNYIFYR